jgi:hypothetical protein
MKPEALSVSFYGWAQVERFMQAWRGAGVIAVARLNAMGRARLTLWRKTQAFVRNRQVCARRSIVGRGEAARVGPGDPERTRRRAPPSGQRATSSEHRAPLDHAVAASRPIGRRQLHSAPGMPDAHARMHLPDRSGSEARASPLQGRESGDTLWYLAVAPVCRLLSNPALAWPRGKGSIRIGFAPALPSTLPAN